jgi:hypothetical protein
MKTVLTFHATTNRGLTQYTISQTEKGYFAHEIGDYLPWPSDDVKKAFRLNPLRRYGNQYGRYWRNAPVKTIDAAFDLCRKNWQSNITHY